MTNQNEITAIFKARKLARRLHQLLREDSMHRLRLYHEYSEEKDDTRWTPDLHLRESIAESLCNKLEEIIVQKCKEEFKEVS